MAASPDVSVIVPCHAAARTVPTLLDSLAAQTLAPERYEVIVVDTGADGTRRILEEIAGRWSGPLLRVERGPLADGPGAKRNHGAALAAGRLLAFTDADCVPEPGWLAAGLSAHESGAAVVQGLTAPPPGAELHRLSHRIYVTDDHGLFETCNIFFARELFERLGGFRLHWYRRYGTPFGEDADLGWRARRTGAPFRFEPDAVVRHPVGPPNLRGHLTEQWRGRAFPALAREAPELRDVLFWRRWFLNRRTAAFAAAAAGAGAAALARHPAPLALGAPYARMLARERRSPRAAAVSLLSDAVLGAGLAYGSLRARSLVL